MKRRDFIAAVGGAAITWPLTARAQQSAQFRRVGVLMSTGESDPVSQARIAFFRKSMSELGWTEDRDLKIELRWGGGDIARMRTYASELTQLTPDVIVSSGTPAAAALKQATATIPVVFALVNDPVAQGLIASMARPGGNITGFSFLEYSMVGKSFEMLRQVTPKLSRVAIMFNPDTYPYYAIHLKSFEAVANGLSLQLVPAPVRSPADIDAVTAELGRQPGGGLLVTPDPFLQVHRGAVITATALHRVAAIYAFRENVAQGGLMSYGADVSDIFRRAASYVDRILRGAKPADLPAQAPVKFETAVNLKAAKELGLDIPQQLLAFADEVIE